MSLTSFRERKIFREEVVNDVLEELRTTTRVVARSGDLPQTWISG